MEFAYKVRDPLANVHQGVIEAATPDEAAQLLRQDGFHVLELLESGGNVMGALFAKRIRRVDIIYVTTQLALMVETGITISVALESIASQEENPTLRKVLTDLKATVEGGADFSTALHEFPQYFDATYVSLVRASEQSGTLSEMLDRIANYMRKELDTRGKVRGALAYPVVMFCIAVGVTVFLLTVILPKFEPLFNRPGMELPGITKVLMSSSKVLLGYWYVWLALFVALIVGFLYARRTEPGRKAIDWAKINAPLLGPLFRKAALSRSIRTLGTMIGSGVTMLDSLRLSADVAGNYYYEKLWLEVIDEVTAGRQICDAVTGSSLMPSTLVQMIAAGENTGKLDVALERVSVYFDTEVDATIKTTTSMMEPLMITGMGIVVGGIGIGLLLPIFSLSKPPSM